MSVKTSTSPSPPSSAVVASSAAIDVRQVGGDILPAEELVRQRAAAHEQVVRDLPPEHAPVGDPLAGVRLRQRVEGRDAGGREREQEAVRPAVDDERVTERGARFGERGDGIGNEDIPRQAHAACDGRHRVDHRTFHAAELGSFRRRALTAAWYRCA